MSEISLPRVRGMQQGRANPRAELKREGRIGQAAKRHGEHTLTIRSHTQEEDDNRA